MFVNQPGSTKQQPGGSKGCTHSGCNDAHSMDARSTDGRHLDQASCDSGQPGAVRCGQSQACACGNQAVASEPSVARSGSLLLQVPAMDCPTEEGQIRRALQPLDEIRALKFDLVSRTIEIDAPERVWPEIEQKIGQTGFETRRLRNEPSSGQAKQSKLTETARALSALAVATLAEFVEIFAPDTQIWTVIGMAIAAAAILLAGFSVLRKGWFALTRANLNINALMTVAVIGAFVIGQWPEAAMVMALYCLAELIAGPCGVPGPQCDQKFTGSCPVICADSA